MRKKLPPVVLIVLSFVAAIFVGTILLYLPISHNAGKSVSFVDSMFIATSAICVTGLTPVANIADTFSVFGKIVLGILIQIGGLGIISVSSFFFLALGAKIGIGNRYILKEALNQDKVTDVLKLLKSIMKITFTIELVGAILNFLVFKDYYDVGSAIGISLFHSVSAFNNAGFDILGDHSLIDYSSNVFLNINTMLLIVLGGLGFIVIRDVVTNKFNLKKIKLHSKIVIYMTIILIVLGTVFIKLSMGNDVTILESMFLSVSSRTAGFASFSTLTINGGALLITMMLMLIGASPVSTGGGIKTTTFYTMIKSMLSFAIGKPTVVKNRKISEESKLKAFVLLFFAIGFIFLSTIIILSIERDNPNCSMESALFESVSAFATVGLSLGLTTHLSIGSKIVLMAVMFFGRLGPITIMSMWNRSWNKPNVNSIDYLEEKLIIG